MSKAIRTILFEEKQVGKYIKSSKKYFLWKFALDERIYEIDLCSSKLSGRRTLKVDGEILFDGKKSGKVFHKSIEIGSHSIILIEVAKAYDLRIDGISFHILQKQAVASVNSPGSQQTLMTDALIPEQQEDWERSAKPFEIIIRPGLNATTREILPIVPKKLKERASLNKPLTLESGFINSY